MTVHNKILADFYDRISMQEFIAEKLRTDAAQKIARNIVLTTCGNTPNKRHLYTNKISFKKII